MESTWLDNGTQIQTSGHWKMAQQRNPKTSANLFFLKSPATSDADFDRSTVPLLAKEMETNKPVLVPCTARPRFVP